MNIPKKGLPVTDLYNSQGNTDLFHPAKPKSYIGVGYKDHGSRTPGHVCKLPGPKDYPERSPKFEQDPLMEQWIALDQEFV
jgi:hypothetical protein